MDFDRVNNEGDYSPGNLRLTTRRRNNLNKRSTVYLLVGGTPRLLADWPSPYSLSRTLKLAKQGYTGEQIVAQARNTVRLGTKGAARLRARLAELGYTTC
jgi:hypothetical protein